MDLSAALFQLRLRLLHELGYLTNVVNHEIVAHKVLGNERPSTASQVEKSLHRVLCRWCNWSGFVPFMLPNRVVGNVLGFEQKIWSVERPFIGPIAQCDPP